MARRFIGADLTCEVCGITVRYTETVFRGPFGETSTQHQRSTAIERLEARIDEDWGPGERCLSCFLRPGKAVS